MNATMTALAHRAVKANGWRWMPGMLTTSSDRVHDASDSADGVLWLVYENEAAQKPGCVEDFAPDLTDPATIGCLLALVREAWDAPAIHVAHDGTNCARPWRAWLPGRPISYGATESVALVAALEAAP